MDKLTKYREIVRQIINEYAKHKPYHGKIDPLPIIDTENDRYQVVQVGWDGVRRVHGCTVHLDIIGEKVWIQYDGCSQPLAQALIDAGVPKEDIVLAFHPEELRQYTGFAVY
ncbi:XisI protein [Calothrix sp. NIES-2098]|uniref:XisI protein n=1 Tax=Calothrix sp. NIES-2098 TaxID=1954171 RepID=UPI000B5EB81F|nr:fdxN element excision controlling factor protein [Calothrix sp. NIES-2098]